MSSGPNHRPASNFEPLLSEAERSAVAHRPARASVRQTLNAAINRPLALLAGRYRANAGFRRNTRIGTAIAALALGVGLFLILRPAPQPDYLDDGLDDVLDFTLLQDEFNNLPIEERMKLMKQLIERFKSMDGGDSVLMASFAAGIAGSARQQMMENASRLAVDLFDSYAQKYTGVADGDKGKFLDDTFVQFTKQMDDVLGNNREVPDEKRLADGREAAKRELDYIQNRSKNPNENGREVGEVLSFLKDGVGKNATPQQRGRVTVLMRDMTKRMRSGQ
jgi:hypothetical protein